MAKKSKPSEEPAMLQDAVALLMADHRRVAKLFADFDNLKEEGSDEEKTAVVKEVCRELAIHTTLEEEIFYPAVRKSIEDDDLMDEALVEHAGAKNLIAQLRGADPEDDLYDAKVTVLAEQIDHHVTEEEGNMFAQARGSGVDLQALGAQMLARKTQLLHAGEAEPAIAPVRASKTSIDVDAPRASRGARPRSQPSVSRARPAQRKAKVAKKKR